MLYKSHSTDHLEDFGIKVGNRVELFENGTVTFNYTDFSPVTHVNAYWMERPIKIKLEPAVTDEEKRVGLQKHSKLEKNCGMYFPYPGGSDVSFHQGTVQFPLDLIFLREGNVIGLKEDTEVGSKERWACTGCDGVIEVVGGYCKKGKIKIGDRVVLWSISKRDAIEVKKEAALLDLAEALNLL